MTCYLVHSEYFLVFIAEDPRPGGCLEPVEQTIWLDDVELSEQLPNGLCAGRNPVDEGHFHLFQSPADRSRSGFQQVVGVPVVVPTWEHFLKAVADSVEPVA